MKTISFIILSWNSESYLEPCLSSLVNRCTEEGITYEAIIIDNGSVDGSVALLRRFEERYPGCFKLIILDRNRGTTYTRNLGLNLAQGEYLCILDSDTELHNGSLSEVLDLLNTRQRVGMIAPQLILPDGSVQNSVKRFPTLWHKIIKIPRILFGIRTWNADFYQNFPFEGERQVDSAISACWIFRRELLNKVGYLDEKILYSPEDLDYSHRIRKAGFTILYYTPLKLLHHTQQISHRKPFSKVSRSHFSGLIYYYRKHGGWLLRPSFNDQVE